MSDVSVNISKVNKFGCFVCPVSLITIKINKLGDAVAHGRGGVDEVTPPSASSS